jgi:type IV pilus assembly protein PilB
MPAQGQPQPPVIPQNQPVSAGSGEVMNRVPTTGAVPTPPPVPPAPTPTPPAAAATTPASPAPPSADGFGTNTQRSLLDVLKEMKALSTEQAEQLEVERISSGKTIEALLEEKNLVSELLLTQAKAALHNIPFVKIAETGSDPQALTQLPEVVANNYQILPISYNKQEGTLTVAMKDPLDLQAIDFAERKSGLKLITRYAMPSELERSIAENYSQSLSSEVTEALEQTTQVAEAEMQRQDLSALAGETIRQAPITKIVQTVVTFAMKARASDVHIEPQEGRTRVRYRIDGILQEKLILPSSVHEAVVSRVKILSGLKIDEKRIPQDGRFTFVSGDEEVDLRISTLPTIHGEKVVMRLLKKNASVPSLPDLGLRGLALRDVEDSIKVPHGIILVTGPTGSGKTTTLYSILDKINTPKVNIITLEDPVEYQMKGVNQVQINPQAGLTFASGLRSFLRQDPNIIMVGEIRDSETSDLAIQASLTGHLVFSTLHTSSAAGALPRLLDMGAEPFLLASSMTCVMAQRVVRRINEQYKEEYKPEPEVLADIKQVLGVHFDNWLKQHGKTEADITIFRAKQDRPQTEPEYKGRIGIFEVMKINEEIGKLILARKPATDLEDLAIKNGMLLMKQDGYLKVLEGITTIEEVLRVAQI